jgi:hypothetical protein
MPSPKQIAKQDSANRVGFLQRRLEALKMLLLHASPQQAKAFARELKSIAGELSSAAKTLGSSGGGAGQGAQADAASLSAAANPQVGSAENVITNASAETDANLAEAENASAKNDGPQVSDIEKKPESKSDKTLSANSDFVSDTSPNDLSSDEIDNAVLRGLVMGAKKMLKEVIDMLKPKLAEADKEGKKDLLDAEKKLSEVDSSLQQSSTTNIYTRLGGFPLDAVSASSVAVSGLNVSVTA